MIYLVLTIMLLQKIFISSDLSLRDYLHQFKEPQNINSNRKLTFNDQFKQLMVVDYFNFMRRKTTPFEPTIA